MSDNPLVADVTYGEDSPWTGAGLLDGIEDVYVAVTEGTWVDTTLAGVGLGLEVASTVLDPFSALLANGLGWAMEYFEPLREMLDALTGVPAITEAHAETWRNMAAYMEQLGTDLQSHLAGDLPDWQGHAAVAYQSLMVNNVDAAMGLGGVALLMAAATDGATELIALTRDIVRDLIADLVARVIVWAVEAIFIVTIPVVAAQIVAAVVKWAGRILLYTTALVTSLTNLSKLVG
ncbi:hypothetical protein J2S43_000886 [Catenuloplanes nepalensis]|uniref:Uncharacterized protein n=1 Tax=Catenuloplanes nepalensis TaxID=587533 RepID=A0ABT9MLS1_9ACTN|nr:hypothetical protein [Catenuloplanes nepalensis]MDP9792374.1 hypothetical protein [Catenuloplanes nepalensis]